MSKYPNEKKTIIRQVVRRGEQKESDLAFFKESGRCKRIEQNATWRPRKFISEKQKVFNSKNI